LIAHVPLSCALTLHISSHIHLNLCKSSTFYGLKTHNIMKNEFTSNAVLNVFSTLEHQSHL